MGRAMLVSKTNGLFAGGFFIVKHDEKIKGTNAASSNEHRMVVGAAEKNILNLTVYA